MCERMSVTLPLPPSVNNYQDYRVRKFGKRFRVEAYPTDDTKAFYHRALDILEEETFKQQWKTPLPEVFVEVEVDIYLRIAKSDADNYFKCTLDALEKSGVVVNDCFIIPKVNNVFIDKDNPRVELRIKKLEKTGIFLNEEEMEKFKENNCKECTRRRKTHCVVFKGFMENRVHDLDEEGNCKHKKSYKEE